MHWILAFVSLLYKNTLCTQCLQLWLSCWTVHPSAGFCSISLPSFPTVNQCNSRWSSWTGSCWFLGRSMSCTWSSCSTSTQTLQRYQCRGLLGRLPLRSSSSSSQPWVQKERLCNLTDSLFWNWFSGIWFYVWSSVQMFCSLWVWGISSVPLVKA